ncbi:DUF952 domain-containing protein [Sneathiella glossodoripedis]|uniref:DUF952 domain-containing protein n=1 Tax=Sneathiella glossodoripedis TaxID=418853 RepID=UPI000A06869E|nr:DUF952 domain-containing protein [Sneathiella glossodoripedis]
MTTIFHMADKDAWAEAVSRGSYPGTPMDQEDGFIHMSTAETIVESAAKHRKGVTNLLLLVIDAEELGEKLVWEPARGGILFPHLYEDLDPEKVRKVVPLPLGDDGRHIFPDLGEI